MSASVELAAQQSEGKKGQDMVTAAEDAKTAQESATIETPEMVRQKELLKLRVERGRVQGHVNAVREMMKNIIVPEGGDPPKELKELAARESLHLDQLRRIQAEIDELEGAALAVALQSSHGGSSVSSRESKPHQKQSSIGLPSFKGSGRTDQEVDPNSPARTSVPPRGDSAPAVLYAIPPSQSHVDVGTTGGYAPSLKTEFHSVGSRGELSKARILSSAPSVDLTLTGTAHRPHPGSLPYEVRDRSGPKGIDPSRLKLPKCTEALELAAHFEVCENIFVEARVGVFVGEGQGRQFRPYGDVHVSCIESFLRTLPEGAIQSSAKRTARKLGWSWQHLRHSVVRRYGRRSAIVDELSKLLRQLEFSSPSEVDAFLEKCEAIMHALEAAYGQDRSETRRVVKHIIGTLPPHIATEIIREIKQTVGMASAMSRRMAMDCDWELLLPFVPNFSPGEEEMMSVSDIIRDVCRTIESGDPASQLTASDRVAYAGDSKARGGSSQGKAQSGGSKGKVPLDSWAKGYAAVYVVRSQSSEKRLDSEAIKKEFDPDVTKFIRGKKQPLALIGYTDVAKGKAAADRGSAKGEYSIRPFQFRAGSGNE